MTAVGASGCDKVVQATVLAETEASLEQGRLRFAEGKTVPEQVDAPERYAADVRIDLEAAPMTEAGEAQNEEAKSAGRTIRLTADAPIEVPDVNEIHLKRSRLAQPDSNKTEEWLGVLCAGGETEEAVEDGVLQGSTVVGGIPYTYVTVTPGQQSEFAENKGMAEVFLQWQVDWSKCQRVSGGYLNTETGEVIPVLKKTEEECRKEAEELLEGMGLDGYALAGSTEEEAVFEWPQSKEDEVRAVTLSYEKLADGVLIAASTAAEYPLYEEEKIENGEQADLWGPESVFFHYEGDRLENLFICTAAEVSDYSDENVFLLPFEEIRKIFEDTVGWKMAGKAQYEEVQEGFGPVVAFCTQYPQTAFDNAKIRIHKVTLKYMRIRDEAALGKEEGLLIPVWDFYGTWEAENYLEDGRLVVEKMEREDISLLTIDARDGTILQRTVGS